MTSGRTVVVTGAGGFLGPHLVRALAPCWRVIGVGRSARPRELDCEWLRVDDRPTSLARAVEQTRPRLVVDVAFVNRRPPEVSVHSYLCSLLAVHLELFETCARLGIPVLLTSSSAVYGNGTEDEPLVEEAPLRPISLYGLAKTMQEALAEHVARSQGLALCTARLFNLLGPGRGLGTVVHDWVAQIAGIVAGTVPPILRVHNRETSRDFVDPRDAARALCSLAEHTLACSSSSIRVLNVARGQAVPLRRISELLESLSPVPYEIVESDPEPGPSDARSQLGDAAKIEALCGWRPEIDWRRSVTDVWQQYVSR